MKNQMGWIKLSLTKDIKKDIHILVTTLQSIPVAKISSRIPVAGEGMTYFHSLPLDDQWKFVFLI